VIFRNELVDFVQRGGMEVPLAALLTYLRFHILNDIELALEPMLLFDLLLRRF